MPSRTFAIGDIHGCLTALDVLLTRIAHTPDDTLVFLGDYVDRGPDSKGVVARLLELTTQCDTVFITGNHEEMARDAAKSPEFWRYWMQYGGLATVESYDVTDFWSEIPDAHRQFFLSTVDWYETDDHILCHAPIRPSRPIAEQSSDDFRWSFVVAHAPHCSGKRVVCGHATQRSGVPAIVHNTVFIDTGACGGGWLTALHLERTEALQANQAGEARVLTRAEFAGQPDDTDGGHG